LERVASADVVAEAMEDYGRLLIATNEKAAGTALLQRASAIRGETAV